MLPSGQASSELRFSFALDFGCGWEHVPSPRLGQERHGQLVWHQLPVLLHGLLVWSKKRFAVFAKTQMETCIDQAPLLSLMALSTNVPGFELKCIRSVIILKTIWQWKFVSENWFGSLKE